MFARMMWNQRREENKEFHILISFFMVLVFSKLKGELYLLGVLCVVYVFKHLIAQ